MRLRRNQLSHHQQTQAAKSLATRCQNQLHFKPKARIALYLANDGEIDPKILIKQLQKRNIVCYLPVLHPIKKNCLWFFQYTKQTKMTRNRFGIPEPDIKTGLKVHPWTLSTALFPLVAFDPNGGRLGMGGGFYDRTFDRKKACNNSLFRKVKLVGLAHHFQMVKALPIEPWDVPLNAIISDKTALIFDKQK